MEINRVGIIIPALNEESTIEKIINSAKLYGTVIVVDDGSIDKTAKISIESGALLVKHATNLGYVQSLSSGLKKASDLCLDIAITIDADGQHRTEYIENFINLIRSGNSVVVGRRSKFQRFAELVFSIVSRLKWGIYDPLCGLKAYDMKFYNEVGFFDEMNSIGAELAIHAAKSNRNIGEIDIQIEKRKDSPRFGNAMRSNFLIFGALLRCLRKF